MKIWLRSVAVQQAVIWLGSVVFISAGMPVALAEEAVNVDVQITQASEDNVSRGFLAQDVHADDITELLISGSHEIEINNKSAFFLNVSYQNQSYSEYSKLSNNQLLVKLDYVFQNSINFRSPVYTLSVSLKESDFDSNLRDSTTVRVAARLLERWTTKIKTVAGLAYESREADTNVFDNTSQSVLLLLDYAVRENFSLFASYTYQTGDTVSTLNTADPALLLQTIGYDNLNTANQDGAVLPDDAFGGVAADQFAYRIDADTQITEFGANLIFNRHHAMDASVMLVTSKINNGLEYDNYIVRLGYLARF